ncbi:thioredoxin family protein [Aliarcobacter trophiarum LMG 25534]|uniref:Thioredoxin family protein n=1 Tax=Aliarcobacter trophiarum LMG 25534 TaxID=1032241 RepID=A0AAD0QLP2_9BACT|nr:thioredoxin fold domain-containing protein [Aliarcobacter trophiarum]AXK48995.1 thioredoxin-related protein, SoxW family [Aliarcobacter trophiarum LMG 25534]RXI24826.1 thioredoxin family protein [Aliarcobacter trophiarum]RXJ92725.1 thioredoxin family protein [Aliarcobacter trophiarum LMG 25534]
MKIISILFVLALTLFANFEDGKKVFDTKCISCHKEYIPMNSIKENFFEKQNSLLNLKAPSANMIVFAMFDSSKKIGDENEKEFQELEIESFLKSYLENPDRFNSICDDNILPFYDNKASMKGQLNDEDYKNLTSYFFGYKENIDKKDTLKYSNYSEEQEKEILKKATIENKKIIIYATSESCYFCKKMDREVFKDISIRKMLDENFIFLEIDMDKFSLPFNLQKEYKRLTPSFFFLNSNAKLISQYPGAWIKSDFMNILKENK